jgi:effector-binding domain-containing protein
MPEIRKLETAKLLCLETTGPYREVSSLFDRMEEFLQSRHVPHKGERLLVVYDPPSQPVTDNAHYAAALELAGETTGDGEMTIVTQSAGWVACETLRGPRAAVPEAYARLLEWIKSQGYRASGPAREYFLAAPLSGEAADTADVELELQLPVEKVEG